MSAVSMKALLETGVHFGHRTRKWHPRMKPYIFTERNKIHIIDLQQTIKQIDVAYNLVRDTVAGGGTVLFVGTKRQAQDAIATEASRAGMPNVTTRWLGGTLTNWRTIKERISELERLERGRDTGAWDSLVKKERLMLQRRIDKLEDRLGGIRNMGDLPSMLFVVDVRREENAVKEANKLGIPVVAMVDTNCDPSTIDWVIPANDDAIRAIKLIVGTMANACLEGDAMRKDGETVPTGGSESTSDTVFALEDDDNLLGESTLRKLSSGELEFEDDGATPAADAGEGDAAASDESASE